MEKKEKNNDRLRVFISSKMMELRDLRDMLNYALTERGIDAWVYEDAAGARPENIIETSLSEIEIADIYVGLFWEKYGEVTIEEFNKARALGKPCFVYIRAKNLLRENMLDAFLKSEVYDLKKGVTYAYFDSAVSLCKRVTDDIIGWLVS